MAFPAEKYFSGALFLWNSSVERNSYDQEISFFQASSSPYQDEGQTPHQISLREMVARLRNGVREFLTKEGQDWCWENYNDLGKLLPEQLIPQPPKVDPLDAMEGCVRYWKMIGGQCPKMKQD